MEFTQENMLDELMAPKRDSWTSFPTEMNEFLPYGWDFAPFDQTPDLLASNASLLGLISPQEFSYSYHVGGSQPFLDTFLAPELESFYENNHTALTADIKNGEFEFLGNGFEEGMSSYSSVDTAQTQANMAVSNLGLCGERKGKGKKIDGQPSKNLMAERRRRKRLNDRLSMLRSIVPKISKMDRTSILGDTIDYMKELLDKINKLKEDGKDENQNQTADLEDLKPKEIQVRNHPKFEVEKTDQETRIEICCAANPGLLLSTIRKLESMGLDIQQCVISCFNDFSLQATCCEEAGHRLIISSEGVKQELFRNAGFGGRPL
ncbi:unnamed protein product [Fraxinus pennsylvanica]|uniref:BHLH domain-containing protein n=1 Tax=Fraxinus pennsylvanica TaxID=56036 RepID=A0AAD1Z617_9LAMI|nr:unnamed protein product [Fraxinus pennsylvanica]